MAPLGARALLTPVQVGPRTSRNRVLFGPLPTDLADGRAISTAHAAFYRARAEGGAGLVVTETASVHPSDWPYEHAPLAADCGPGWQGVAEACGPSGALVLASIGHRGSQGSTLWSRRPLWSPSGVPDPSSREVPEVMEAEAVNTLVDGFADAAARAWAAGLAGVEVDAGATSLIRQFCSPLTNHRRDRWSGPDPNLALEVLRAVRAAAPGSVVGLRLCVDELAPWAGITPRAGVALAASLTPLVDYLVVLRGGPTAPFAYRPDGHADPGVGRHLAGDVRAAVDGRTPVVWQGSVVDPDRAGSGVVEGVCDMVEMTRAQLADPRLVTHLIADDLPAIRPCVLCNQRCLVDDDRGAPLSCTVEPDTVTGPTRPSGPAGVVGPQRRDTKQSPGALLVVGAGPAGLEAAISAAGAGWAVTVLEAAADPGGALVPAAAAPGRHRLGALVDWQVAACRRLGVTLHTRTAADLATVESHPGPVVLATGSVRRPPEFAVAPGARVVDAATWLAGGASGGSGPAAVWDPIGGPVGVSVCEALAAADRPVVLLTPDPLAGVGLAATGDLVPAHVRMARAGVEVVVRVELRAALPGRVEVADRSSGAVRSLPADLVVDAGPRLADDALWSQLGRHRRERVWRVGDAFAPRTVTEAIQDGRRIAALIQVRA